jgi:hypothetical protein
VVDAAVGDQLADENTLTASEVAHPPGTGCTHGGQRRTASQLGEWHRPIRAVQQKGTVDGVVEFVGIGVVDLGETSHRGLRQFATVSEVAAGDQSPLRVRREPSLAGRISLSTSSLLTQ